MKKVLVFGNFAPPHLGHSALIDFAVQLGQQTIVLINGDHHATIPGPLRKLWLQEMHPEANIELLQESIPRDDAKHWAQRVKKHLGCNPDIFCTSEKSGQDYAKQLGAECVIFAAQSNTTAVSSAMIRENPFLNWQNLHPVVRAHFTKRIALLGAESCGKTTLAEALAHHYKTYWVPEYGRFYWEAKKYAGEFPIWQEQEFIHIAAMQNQLEQQYAKRSRHLLFCDTNAFATSVWHRRYLENYSTQVDATWKNNNYDLVFLCENDIPFVQDGVRDGEAIRPEMTNWFKQRLEQFAIPYTLLTGDLQHRINLAKKQIDLMMAPFLSSFSAQDRQDK